MVKNRGLYIYTEKLVQIMNKRDKIQILKHI